MTFKHTKFEDSSTMRSLVKVAQEKGWVKEEPLQKTASPKLDLKPTTNLTENLVKLCSGLRASGFEKQAEELESKFVQFKQAAANSLYDVSNEKGEDLIQAAHPKGSHKMEDIDSKEATFEDILDKHFKMMQVVDKKPTGKLSNASEIIGAVKTVLSNAKVVTAAPTLDNLYEQANTVFQKFKQIYSNISLQTGNDVSSNRSYFDALQRGIDDRKVYSSRGLENSLIDALDNLKNEEEPGFFASGEETQKWQDVILPMIGIASRFANQFHAIVAEIRKLETTAKTQEVTKKYDPDATGEETPAGERIREPTSFEKLTPQAQKIDVLISRLKGFQLIDALSKYPAATKWITDEMAQLTRLKGHFQDPNAATVMPQLEKELSNEEININQFSKTWLGRV